MAEGGEAAEAAAATRIAAMSRGHKARAEVKEKKKVKRERDDAITRIQATMRGRQARRFEQKQLEILEGFSSANAPFGTDELQWLLAESWNRGCAVRLTRFKSCSIP